MNYNALVSAIQHYTVDDSTELLEAIPQLVENACLTIARETDSVGLNATVSVVCSVGNPIVSVSSGWLVIKTVAKTSSGNKKFLKHRPYDYLIESWPDVASVGGNPTAYNRLNNSQLYVTPTPSTTQQLELRVVTVSIPSSSNQTCYLLDFQPNLLLYRSLVEANLYKLNPEDAKSWADMYVAERDAVNNEARRNRRDDGFTPIMGPITQNTLKGDK